MPPKDPKLEMAKKVQKSGHRLTFDVAKVLKKNDWNFKISTRYVDDSTGKDRENDIIANKFFKLELDNVEVFFYLKLIIETKYLNDEYVFFMEENNLDRIESTHQRFHFSSMRNNINVVEPIMNDLTSDINHRYFSTKEVAVMFDNLTKNDSDVMFQTTSSTIKAIIFERDKIIESHLSKNFILYYPIVVTKGKKFLTVSSQTNFDEVPEIQKAMGEEQYLLCKVNYFNRLNLNDEPDLRTYSEYFIDIIDIAKFDDLLKDIERQTEFILRKYLA